MISCEDRNLYIARIGKDFTFTDDRDCLPPDAEMTDTQVIWHPAMEVTIRKCFENAGASVDCNYSQEFEDWLNYQQEFSTY